VESVEASNIVGSAHGGGAMISLSGSELFLFSFYTRNTPDQHRHCITVVFARRDINPSSCLERIREHLDEKCVSPDNILLIGSNAHADSMVTQAAPESALLGGLPEVTRFHGTPRVTPVSFDINGELRELRHDGQPVENVELLNSGLVSELLYAGQLEIVKKYGPVIEAGGGYHFIKPSQRHTRKFIRTGNILLHSGEIAFLALALLPYVPEGLEYIYTDSASINSLGYALAQLRHELDSELVEPGIASFSSYLAVDQDAPLEHAERCMCLVSSSTSCKLVSTISEKHRIHPSRIVTILYCGLKPNRHNVLCDITKDESRQGIEEPWDSYDPGPCELCAQGSSTIRIVCDTFLPANPDVKPVMLTVQHAPTGLSSFMKSVSGRDAIHCFTSVHNASYDCYVDLSRILNSEFTAVGGKSEFQERVHQKIQDAIPLSATHFIHLDDHASETLCEAVVEFAKGKSRQQLKTHSAREVMRFPSEHVMNRETVVIVASVADTGRSLLNLSQILREIHRDGPIVYFIAYTRTANEVQWKEIESNLSFGTRLNEHAVHVVQKISMPRYDPSHGSSWEVERKYLTELRGRIPDLLSAEKLSDRRDEIERFIAERLKQLNCLDKESGLAGMLFWPGIASDEAPYLHGSPLQLSPNFAFWPGFQYSSNQVSQEEVYATMAMVLHKMRQSSTTRAIDFGQHYNRQVLSPRNFDRFNDGIIQAALLRAARLNELDYSADTALSSAMTEVLKVIFDGFLEARGQAAPEFLLAIASGRLRLAYEHIDPLCDYLSDTGGWPGLFELLIRDIRRASERLAVTPNQHAGIDGP